MIYHARIREPPKKAQTRVSGTYKENHLGSTPPPSNNCTWRFTGNLWPKMVGSPCGDSYYVGVNPKATSWWFQPTSKNMSQNGNLPQIRVNIKNFLKPPPRQPFFLSCKEGQCFGTKELLADFSPTNLDDVDHWDQYNLRAHRLRFWLLIMRARKKETTLLSIEYWLFKVPGSL